MVCVRYVSEGGLEPPRPCGHQPLKLARLPIPPLRRGGERYPTAEAVRVLPSPVPSTRSDRSPRYRSAVTRLAFTAVIEPSGRGGGGALVRLPVDAAELFGTRARFPVKVTFNAISYRGSTMPMGDGSFCVGITKAIQAQAGARVGDAVAVTLERDEDVRTVDVPAELQAAFAADPMAAERFRTMAFTHRREYAEWVGSAKKPETRQRRAAKAIEMIADAARLS